MTTAAPRTVMKVLSLLFGVGLACLNVSIVSDASADDYLAPQEGGSGYVFPSKPDDLFGVPLPGRVWPPRGIANLAAQFPPDKFIFRGELPFNDGFQQGLNARCQAPGPNSFSLGAVVTHARGSDKYNSCFLSFTSKPEVACRYIQNGGYVYIVPRDLIPDGISTNEVWPENPHKFEAETLAKLRVPPENICGRIKVCGRTGNMQLEQNPIFGKAPVAQVELSAPVQAAVRPPPPRPGFGQQGGAVVGGVLIGGGVEVIKETGLATQEQLIVPMLGANGVVAYVTGGRPALVGGGVGLGGGLAGSAVASAMGASANQSELMGAYGSFASGFCTGNPGAGVANGVGIVASYAGSGAVGVCSGCYKYGAGNFLWTLGDVFWREGLMPR